MLDSTLDLTFERSVQHVVSFGCYQATIECKGTATAGDVLIAAAARAYLSERKQAGESAPDVLSAAEFAQYLRRCVVDYRPAAAAEAQVDLPW